MSERYSEKEAVAAVPRLTRTRLIAFVEAEIVSPQRAETGLIFHRIDLARMELLCELSEQFDLGDDALEVVISLIDQLHGMRADFRAMARAIESEPRDARQRIGEALRRARSRQGGG